MPEVHQSIFAVFNIRIDMPSQRRNHTLIFSLPANRRAPIAIGRYRFPAFLFFLLHFQEIITRSKVCSGVMRPKSHLYRFTVTLFDLVV